MAKQGAVRQDRGNVESGKLRSVRGRASDAEVYVFDDSAGDAEYEIVPASLDQGVGLLIWSPLAGGLLSLAGRGTLQCLSLLLTTTAQTPEPVDLKVIDRILAAV